MQTKNNLHRFSVVSVCFFALLLASAKSYGHTIIANVSGLGGTITPFGTVTVANNGSQTFTIGPSSELLDVYVDGMSIGAATSYTFSNVTADHSIIATFACSANKPVRLDSDGSFYSTISAAYDAAVQSGLTNFTLDVMAGTLPQENLTFDSNVSVTLKGGFDCSFQTDTMTSALTGSMTIGTDSVTPSNLSVSSTPACQPGDPNNYPGNTETCDGQDNNCNGLVDEGLNTDADGDGYYAAGSCALQLNPTLPVDCDDHDPTVYPGAPELCDNKDNNCNGQIDEGFPAIDNDGDGYAPIGSCGSGLPKTDCNDNDPSINPGAAEIWGDGIDQNCDGREITSADMTCVNCHGYTNIDAIHTHIQTPDSTCVSCHPWVTSRILDGHQTSSILDGHYGKTIPANNDGLTVGSKIGCESCHDESPTAVVWPRVLAVGVGNETCDTCHINRAAKHDTNNAHVNRGIDPTCAECHTSDTTTLGSPGSGTLTSEADIDALHLSDCTLCHTSTLPSVVATITAGMAGTPVNCDNCHDGTANGAPSHGTTFATAAAVHTQFNTDPNCFTCHVSNTVEERLSLHPDCATCHTSTLPSVESTISTGMAGTAINCENCHDGTTGGAPVHGTTFKTVAPLHTQINEDANCSACHASDTAEARLSLHPDCSTCHSSTLSSVETTISNGIAAISSGIAGTAINCENCHDGTANGAPLHGLTFATAAAVHTKFNADTNCSACHESDTAEERLSLHPDCTTCHSSTLSSVVTTISSGIAGTAINCENCHDGTANGAPLHGLTFATAAAVHTQFNADSNCSACHVSDTAEERLSLHPDCTTCHTSTLSSVVTTISSGIAGTAINCENCHDGTANGAPVHGTTMATAATVHTQFNADANCSACHVSGTAEERLSLHPDCTTCHTSTLSSVVTTISSGIAGTAINCENCHDGTVNGAPLHGLTFTTAAAVHTQFNADTNCSACHESDTAEERLSLHPDCTTCHTSTLSSVVTTINSGIAGTAINCENCHDGTVNGAPLHGLTFTTAAAVHTQFNADTNCSACHESDTAEERLSLHPDCTTCHTSTLSSVVTTISSGIAGTTINCENCHDGTANGAPVHGTTMETAAAVHTQFNADANCSACHVIDTAEERLSLHPDCTTCHSSTLSSVVTTISSGIAGTPINCENCHDGTANGAPYHGLTPDTAAAVHGNFTATTLCASCHTIDTAAERLSLHPDCTTCHTSTVPTVTTTIANGIAGSQVQCTSCHTADPATFHHTNPNAVAGQCTWCHADPRGTWGSMTPGDNGTTSPYPTQLACATCHVRVVGSTIYIDKIAYTAKNVNNSIYYTAPNRLVQHTLTGITAGTINNYGICFSCHNGTTAPAVAPMHAMPTSPASTARLQNMQYAPGAGTFNLQYQTWDCKGEGCSFGIKGTVNYPNLRLNYAQPNISFQQISVPCGSFNDCSADSTVSVPVLPAVANATATTSKGTGTDSGIAGTTGNTAVVANDDPYTIKQGVSATLDVLLNDSDPYGNALTITAVGTPSNGGTVTNNGISLTYTPSANFTGTETFTYTVTDTTGLTATATVTATVTQNNSAYPPAP